MLPTSVRPGQSYTSASPNRRSPLKTLPATPSQFRPLNGPARARTTEAQAAPRPNNPFGSFQTRTPDRSAGMPLIDEEKQRLKELEKHQVQWLAPPPRKEQSRFSLASNYTSSSSSAASLVSYQSGRVHRSADPEFWDITPGTPGSAKDDWLHNPDPRRDRRTDRGGSIFTYRGFTNIGCLVVFVIAVVGLFVGYPVLSRYRFSSQSTLGGFNLGGVNATGQFPMITQGNFGLIDKDTPKEAYTKQSYQSNGADLQLVFSDEFNTDGRSFYPGDDPYWEAEDLHYWETNNLEWYDPIAVTTSGGNLVITLSHQETHGLNYQSGLISSWNKFCFTGGLIEVNAILPGASNVQGLWPAVWTMGNLGRMGYGATLEGQWPYSYTACDVGTLPNQTFPNGTPTANTQGNDPANGGALSYLPGQRLSSCTCVGEDHPGPSNADGSFAGRGVPEIDIFEAVIESGTLIGQVSQSAQWAPFNEHYEAVVNDQTYIIQDPDAKANTYIGGAFQQTTSVLANTNSSCAYETSGASACYEIYGFEYKPGSDGFITWVSDGKASWTITGGAMVPDAVSGASQRLVSEEPMYIIANLGISPQFSPIDFAHLVFPAHLYIDYIRVYQPKDQVNIGCSPSDHPTEDYINRHIDAYTNANMTTWAQAGQTLPKNRLIDTC